MIEQVWPHRVAAQLMSGGDPHCPAHLRSQVDSHLAMAIHTKAAAICSEPLRGQRVAILKRVPELIRERVKQRVLAIY